MSSLPTSMASEGSSGGDGDGAAGGAATATLSSSSSASATSSAESPPTTTRARPVGPGNDVARETAALAIPSTSSSSHLNLVSALKQSPSGLPSEPTKQQLLDNETKAVNADDEDRERSTINESISITLNEAVGAATISPSGRDVCLAARKGLFIVDLDDPWATPRFLPHYSAIVADVQWSPHPARAHWVVSTSGDKGLVWNLNVASGYSPIEFVTVGHERSITDMNWAVFNVDLLATCGIDGNVLCFDMRVNSNGNHGYQKPVMRYCGWRYGATQVKWNRQNEHELASSHGEFVYVWDDRHGSKPLIEIKAHNSKIYGIDYSRKSKDRLVTCSLDSTVKYWDLRNTSPNDSGIIDTPDQMIQTSSPVWRARHTPFGDGIVTLPQRSETDLKIWSAPTSTTPSSEVFRLTGHNDVVREFLWRTKGGNNPNDDDRQFQLITWGSDRQLLLTPIPEAITSAVGHVPHSPIRVRQTRLNAENRSYREVLPSPNHLAASGATALSPTGFSPTLSSGYHSIHGSSHPRGMAIPLGSHDKQMTPPSLQQHNSHSSAGISSSRYPFVTASRYGRSQNSAGATSGTSLSSSAGASLGTSPAEGARMSAYVRSSNARNGSDKENRQKFSVSSDHLSRTHVRHPASSAAITGTTHGNSGRGGYMTRGNARRPGGQDAVTWMEGVRLVSAGNNTSGIDDINPDDGLPHDPAGLVEVASSIGDKDVVPLHEELTAIARAFETKVRFEKIGVTTRTLVAAMYGPWAASGLSTFLRVTFTFPPNYPATSLNLDIERSSGITNKARAKLLAGVRSLASRYALKKQNSLEACLTCLLGGKVIEPEDDDMNDETIDGVNHLHLSTLSGTTTTVGPGGTHLVVRNLDGEDDEGGLSDGDDPDDLERMLANRNCPLPRRAGAVFSPNGTLFAFFPLDSLHNTTSGRNNEKRSRSPSPSDDKKMRQRRRRLFESFGVIPALQAKKSPRGVGGRGLSHYSGSVFGTQSALHAPDPEQVDEEEEDSDEVLNMPSLLLSHRRPSRGRTESLATSRHASRHHQHARGTGRAFNSRVYVHNLQDLTGVDTALSTHYTMHGPISSFISSNALMIESIEDTKIPWIVKTAWASLEQLLEASLHASSAEENDDHPSLPIILGEKLPEQMICDLLEIFLGLGDVQMLGMLACIIELDRRNLATMKPGLPRKLSRSPGQSGAVDYFSLRPTRSSKSSDTISHLKAGPASGSEYPTGRPASQALITPLSAGGVGPLKSPSAWLLSSSVGTQGSSAGSSTKGSSWANNLSTFFKSSTNLSAANNNSSTSHLPGLLSSGGSGKATPPSGMASPASLSPAFVKKASIGPLTEVTRKAGGIASGRPTITPVSGSGLGSKSRSATHVSFAATTVSTPSYSDGQQGGGSGERGSSATPPSGSGDTDTPRNVSKTTGKMGSFKIVVRNKRAQDVNGGISHRSLLLTTKVQAMLEYYRLLYSELLHRLELPQQRAQVLKLTRSAVQRDQHSYSTTILHAMSGIMYALDRSLVIEEACQTCGHALNGRSPAHCGHCKKKSEAGPCVICHLPLGDLIDTCLRCLHSSHLSCLQDWREQESTCPGACGCECTNLKDDLVAVGGKNGMTAAVSFRAMSS